MKVANLIKKLENTPEVTELKITAEPARWGGYNVRLYCLVNNYYDLTVTDQVSSDDHTHATNVLGFTAEKAIAQFKTHDIRSFHAKPFHDESDMMSDYFAGSFHEKIKDVDWLVSVSAGREGKYATR